jgi:Lrp/AsnC family leucine-responsive transcriptional regulator
LEDRLVAQSANTIALDAKDKALLRLITGAPRSTVTELARALKMSAPAVRDRLRRLENAGVVAGWSVKLDAKSLGYPVTAFVRIRPMPGKLSQIAALAAKIPEVSECYRITGEDCFIMRVHLESLESMDVILDKFLAFGQTTTSIVQSTIVAPRNLPVK